MINKQVSMEPRHLSTRVHSFSLAWQATAVRISDTYPTFRMWMTCNIIDCFSSISQTWILTSSWTRVIKQNWHTCLYSSSCWSRATYRKRVSPRRQIQHLIITISALGSLRVHDTTSSLPPCWRFCTLLQYKATGLLLFVCDEQTTVYGWQAFTPPLHFLDGLFSVIFVFEGTVTSFISASCSFVTNACFLVQRTIWLFNWKNFTVESFIGCFDSLFSVDGI